MCFKKRSLSQRIGETGESIVKEWASKNNLSATKYAYDYGWDFSILCFNKINNTEVLNGRSFLAQCKATEDENENYVTIDNADAWLYLSSTSQFCLLSVDNIGRVVKFRFGDNKLIDLLVKFVNSKNETLNLSISKYFFDDKLTSEHIKTNTSQSYFNRLKTYIAQKLISVKDPTIKLSIRTSENEFAVNVNSPWVTNIINPEYIFSNGKYGELFSNPEIIQIINEHYPDSDSLIIYGNIGKNSKLSGGHNKIITDAISFPYNGDTHFRTKSGFTFIAGPCLSTGDKRMHECSLKVENSIYPLCSCNKDIEAFKGMLETNAFYINGHKTYDLTPTNPLVSFFETAVDVFELFSIGLTEFGYITAADLNDYNAFLTVKLIRGLVKKERIVNDFVLTKDDNFGRVPKKGKVAIVFQVRKKKYVAKVNCSFEMFLNDGFAVGIGAFSPITVNFEEFALKREILIPELWLNPDFPVIPLGLTKNTVMQLNYEDWPFEL